MEGEISRFSQYNTYPQDGSHGSKDTTLRSQGKTLLLGNSLNDRDIGGPASRPGTTLDIEHVARILNVFVNASSSQMTQTSHCRSAF